MKIRKKELIGQLVEECGYSQRSARMVIDDFIKIINYNMEKGNTVVLRDLGTFDMLWREPREVVSIMTKEKVEVPGHWYPRFYASVTLKESVNKWANHFADHSAPLDEEDIIDEEENNE